MQSVQAVCSREDIQESNKCSLWLSELVLAVAARLNGSATAAEGSLVLGIESSCDDTGVAVVRASDGAILGQVRLLPGPQVQHSKASFVRLFPAFALACLCSPVLQCHTAEGCTKCVRAHTVRQEGSAVLTQVRLPHRTFGHPVN